MDKSTDQLMDRQGYQRSQRLEEYSPKYQQFWLILSGVLMGA